MSILFAFPGISTAWFWQILVAVSMILWIIGAGLFDRSAQQQPEGSDEARKAQQGQPQGPISVDFMALIHAVEAQGNANRAEEQAEDRGKRNREIITIVLLFITMAAIIMQVSEMIKVYDPIRDQSTAALDQAKAAKIQADAAKTQADTAKDAAAAAQESGVAAERAWVGPNGATIEAAPAIGSDVKIHVTYQNTGRQPARGFMPSIDPFIATPDDLKTSTVGLKILENLNRCRNTQPVEGAQVVYPTTGFGGNQLNPIIDKSLIDDRVVKGDSIIFITGCFAYETFGKPHHSEFCFFFKAGSTPLPNLNFCSGGSDAD